MKIKRFISFKRNVFTINDLELTDEFDLHMVATKQLTI
jgi:hypothetical protein